MALRQLFYLYEMELFPSLQLTQLPDNAALAEHELTPDVAKSLLVIYEGDLPFLNKVLAAAGYQDPKQDLHLLRHEPDDPAFDLATLVRRLNVDKVILFGQDLAQLGLHFHIAHYAPLTIGAATYMVCPGVAQIAAAKQAGNKKPSVNLWRGIQAAFLKK